MSIQLPAGSVSGMPCNNLSSARTNTYFELRQMYSTNLEESKAFKHPSVQVNLHAYHSYSLDFCFVTNIAWERVFLVSSLQFCSAS